MKLTEFEKEMHQKLCERGIILWSSTSNQEAKALNRLVKKGFAVYDGEHMLWEQLS